MAVFSDRAGIRAILDALRRSNVSLKDGCPGYSPRASAQIEVSWAVLFFNRNIRVGAVFLTRDGMCASAGNRLYGVDPQDLGLYLSRTFSFMNF